MNCMDNRESSTLLRLRRSEAVPLPVLRGHDSKQNKIKPRTSRLNLNNAVVLGGTQRKLKATTVRYNNEGPASHLPRLSLVCRAPRLPAVDKHSLANIAV